MRTARYFFVFTLVLTAAPQDKPRTLKPGFNLFSKEQDIQLGKEAAAEVEKQYAVVGDATLNSYLQRIGGKLAATPESGGYPYSFKLVSDKSINAFALPGGPTFVHTGLLAAADNEAQIAGVLAHEISHVALRHGTNQASKANLIQLPAVLAGAVAGSKGSMLGSLAQLGIGVGAGSVLLKFSRDAERDADLLGTRIMAKAGYNPIEMARFFEKLEAEGGARGPQFLSDHPNPGNRRKAVENEIRFLPASDYTLGDAQAFSRMQQQVANLPAPPARGQQTAALPKVTASSRLKVHQTDAYSISYPENWQVHADQQSRGATIAPQEGIVGSSIGIGAIVAFHTPQVRGDLRQETDDLIRQITSQNPGMKALNSGSGRVDGQQAMMVTLESQSPYSGQTETDTLVSVQRPQGLFYVVLIAPKSAAADLRGAFNNILRSIRFAK